MAVEEMTQGVQLTAKEKEINTDMLNGVLDNYPKSAVFSCTFQRTDGR